MSTPTWASSAPAVSFIGLSDSVHSLQKTKSHTHARDSPTRSLWGTQHFCGPPSCWGPPHNGEKIPVLKNNPALVPAVQLRSRPALHVGPSLPAPISWSPGASDRQLPLQHSWCCCCQIGPWAAGTGRGRHRSGCRSSRCSCTARSATARRCTEWWTPCRTPVHCRRTGPAHVNRTNQFRQCLMALPC